MDFSISKTSEEDVLGFLRANYNQFGNDFENMSESSNYSHKLFSRSSRFELWESGHLIGLLCVYINENIKQAYIPYICVCKEYKNKGLGALLLNKLIDNIKSSHKYISYIALEVVISNVKARMFYEKFSFEEISRNSLKIQMRKMLG